MEEKLDSKKGVNIPIRDHSQHTHMNSTLIGGGWSKKLDEVSVPTKRQFPDSAGSKLLPDQKQNLLPDSEASVDIGAPVETEAPTSAEANTVTRASI